MSRSASQRWVLVGGFAVVAVYAVVAVVEVVVSRDAMAAVPFAYAGVSIAAPLVVMWRVLGPPRGGGQESDGGDGGSGDDDGPGPSRGGDDEPAEPPWWPEFEFERELEAYPERRAAVGKR